MAVVVTNDRTEHCLRECLKAEGYELSPRLANGETGVDIVARFAEETIHIEVIGFKKSPPVRSRDFYEAFFRAISRIGSGGKHAVIAVPARFERGLPQRARHYGKS